MNTCLQKTRKFNELFTISTCVNIISILTLLFAFGVGLSNGFSLNGVLKLKKNMAFDHQANEYHHKILRELNIAIGYGEALDNWKPQNKNSNYFRALSHFSREINNIYDSYNFMKLSESEIEVLSSLKSTLIKLPNPENTDSATELSGSLSATMFSAENGINQQILTYLKFLRDECMNIILREEEQAIRTLVKIDNNFYISMISLVAVLIILSGISVWFIRARILKPIKLIAKATKLLGKGELFTKTPIVYYRDEIADLAKGVDSIRNEMVRRVHAEEALRDTENKFQGILNLSTLAIITLDHNRKIQTFNKGAESYFGYTQSEIIDQPLDKLIPSRYRTNHTNLVETFVGGQESSRSMINSNGVFALRKDGSEFPIEASISRNGCGGNSVLTVVLRDITERMKRESDIRKGRDLLRAIIDHLPGGICVFGKDLIVLAINQKYFDLVGLTPENHPVGSPYRSMVEALARKGWYGSGDVEEITSERIKSLKEEPTQKYHRVSPQGNVIAIRSTPMPEGGIVRTYVDITSEVNDQEELREHRDHLAELVQTQTKEIHKKAEDLEKALLQQKEFNELQNKFISLASHELRTPLTIIDSISQRLIRKKEKLHEEGYLENRVKKIRHAVARMINLIESTLMATRLEAGKIEGNFERVDIGSLIHIISKRQQEISPTHEIEISFKEFPNSIIGDETLLDHVFTNLLSNAVKYSPDNPLIEIEGWRDSNHVVIRFSDKGLGISENDLLHLFKRFFRADTAEGIKGTGIGLVIVKEFIELHEGSVHVESVEGQGTSVIVRLPIEGPKNWSSPFEDTNPDDDKQKPCNRAFVA